jgi:hypothetical protein
VSQIDKLVLTGECLLKLAENFWPVLAFIAIVAVSGFVIERMEGKK